MIEAIDLHKSYGTHTVLDGVSFRVESGTVAALIGPNGSGKTTTLHLLAGLVAPDDGGAVIEDVDMTTDRFRQLMGQKHLSFLPQEVRFHEALTPRQVLRFYAGLRDVPVESLDGLLGEVALSEAADRPCGTLSGGMRQRLGLAILKLADAPVLLLDEPGLSLDPEWRSFLAKRLRAHADAGGTVLMATHLLDVWRPLVDRVLRCEDGHIQEMQAEDESAAMPADVSGRPDS